MLVLSRKVGEKIRIGDNIEVQITAVRGGRVSVGIVAPSSVPIVRSELTPVRAPAASRGLSDQEVSVGGLASGLCGIQAGNQREMTPALRC